MPEFGYSPTVSLDILTPTILRETLLTLRSRLASRFYPPTSESPELPVRYTGYNRVVSLTTT